MYSFLENLDIFLKDSTTFIFGIQRLIRWFLSVQKLGVTQHQSNRFLAIHIISKACKTSIFKLHNFFFAETRVRLKPSWNILFWNESKLVQSTKNILFSDYFLGVFYLVHFWSNFLSIIYILSYGHDFNLDWSNYLNNFKNSIEICL